MFPRVGRGGGGGDGGRERGEPALPAWGRARPGSDPDSGFRSAPETTRHRKPARPAAKHGGKCSPPPAGRAAALSRSRRPRRAGSSLSGQRRRRRPRGSPSRARSRPAPPVPPSAAPARRFGLRLGWRRRVAAIELGVAPWLRLSRVLPESASREGGVPKRPVRRRSGLTETPPRAPGRVWGLWFFPSEAPNK